MAKIFLANELGLGIGHLRMLLPIAHALRDRGHECVLGVPSLADAAPVVASEGLPFVMTPTVRTWIARREGFTARNYTDIAGMMGFGKADALLALTSVWDSMIDQIGADLVVCDHSPSLCLAAMGRVPVVQVGNDYLLPPADGATFPRYVDGAPMLNESEIMARVVEIQKRRGRPAPATFTEIFRTAGRFVGVYPPLDFFGGIRRDPVVGPFDEQFEPVPMPDEPRIFVYLGAEYPQTRHALEGIARLGVPVEAYIRRADAALLEEFADSGIVFHSEPQPMADMLRRVTVAVHHGGQGMSNSLLAAGRVQGLVPHHIESGVKGNTLQDLGVGLRLWRQDRTGAPMSVFRRLVSDERLRRRAVELAEKLRAQGPWTPVERVVEHCEAILRGSAPRLVAG